MTCSVEGSFEGGCTCGEVRYRMRRAPMIVHCCHCRWCQRESGAAFALNALVEASEVELLRGEPETIATPTNSGRGQEILRCPACKVAVWSHYSAAGRAVCFVRVGTLDEPDRCPPDLHIFTSSKQPWLRLGADVPVFEAFYRRSEQWPAESVARYQRALGR